MFTYCLLPLSPILLKLQKVNGPPHQSPIHDGLQESPGELARICSEQVGRERRPRRYKEQGLLKNEKRKHVGAILDFTV